jgi:hypothetical protein
MPDRRWKRIACAIGRWVCAMGIIQGAAAGFWPLPGKTSDPADPEPSPKLTDPPPGHPERLVVEPPTETERRLWAQLDGQR